MFDGGQHDDGKHQLGCCKHFNEQSLHDRGVAAQSDIHWEWTRKYGGSDGRSCNASEDLCEHDEAHPRGRDCTDEP